MLCCRHISHDVHARCSRKASHCDSPCCTCILLSRCRMMIAFFFFFFFSALLRYRADSLRSHVIQHERLAFFVCLFTARFGISFEVVYLQRWHGWSHTNPLPSRRVLCTPCNHAPCHFMQNHIRKVHAYLAVTCHLNVWQNDQGLLRATAIPKLESAQTALAWLMPQKSAAVSARSVYTVQPRTMCL